MNTSSKELSRSKIEVLVKRYDSPDCHHYDFTEQDTITNFILPFLEALGWNIFNVYEVKQRGYPQNFRRALPPEERPLNFPDCIILLNGSPHIVIEFKGLNYGTVDRYETVVKKLLEKAEYLGFKYAVLTRFAETVVYDGANGNQLIRFSNPKEYLSKFEELWQYLSKEKAWE